MAKTKRTKAPAEPTASVKERLAAALAPDLSARLRSLAREVEFEVFAQLAPLPPPTGVIALAERRTVDPDTVLADPRALPVVLLEDPRDLGNMGACVRVAAAADVAGVLTTDGGIVVTALLDGTIVALDDQTLEELWSINVGTGFNAPPMTYSVNGKQYIAIASGLYNNAKGKLSKSPEMRNLSNASMIFVFGL